MKKSLLLVLAFQALFSFSQQTDTIKVMAYNLLNFPQQSPGRMADLKIIVQDALPDIFMVCELTSASGGSAILNDALNEDGITYYEKVNFVQTSGGATNNMLYFNTNKLGLAEQNEIQTSLRDINEYVLYYKSTDIATTQDTTFFYCYVAHLKAAQGFETDRNSQAQDAKDFMATRAGLENVLFGGDFNLYGSSEPAWNTILTGAGVSLVDPINSPGEWSADWGYADIHTQSTRNISIDFGAGGGMDDRFDFIFMSPDLQSWANQAKYIDGSYWAYGQDGNHYNDSITAAPTNTSRPWNVIQALYNMSDHLPVYMEVEVQTAFNTITENPKGIKAHYDPDYKLIHLTSKGTEHIGEFKVFDMMGREVLTHSNNESYIDVSTLTEGTYILRSVNSDFSFKFVW